MSSKLTERLVDVQRAVPTRPLLAMRLIVRRIVLVGQTPATSGCPPLSEDPSVVGILQFSLQFGTVQTRVPKRSIVRQTRSGNRPERPPNLL